MTDQPGIPISMTPILDREIMSELVCVMGDDMAEFIETFIVYSSDLLGRMTRHAELAEVDQLIMSVHSFKGSSKNIGAFVLGELLCSLEQSLRDDGLGKIDVTFPLVHQAYKDVCCALEEFLK